MACSPRPAVQTSSFPVVRARTSTDMPFSRSSAVYRVHRCESCRQCVARTESRGDPSDSVSGCVSKTQGGDRVAHPYPDTGYRVTQNPSGQVAILAWLSALEGKSAPSSWFPGHRTLGELYMVVSHLVIIQPGMVGSG